MRQDESSDFFHKFPSALSWLAYFDIFWIL